MEPQIVEPEFTEAEIELAYTGFKKLAGQLAGKVKNPAAVAASIGRKKYGPAKFSKLAAAARKKGTKKGFKANKDRAANVKASYEVGNVVGLSNECGVVQSVMGDNLIVHSASGTKTVNAAAVRKLS